jgi:hypothetical protein
MPTMGKGSDPAVRTEAAEMDFFAGGVRFDIAVLGIVSSNGYRLGKFSISA